MAENGFKVDEVRELGTTVSVCSYYDDKAHQYDVHSEEEGYHGPSLVAGVVRRLHTDTGIRILDVCAGTGAAAVQLALHGFTNVDALDGSPLMLQVAKQRNLYREYVEALLHPGEETAIPAETYDCVICSGGFLGGHLKPPVVSEFARVLKKGCLCVIGMREAWLSSVAEYDGILEPYLRDFEGWELLERAKVEHWYGDWPGVIFVFRKH